MNLNKLIVLDTEHANNRLPNGEPIIDFMNNAIKTNVKVMKGTCLFKELDLLGINNDEDYSFVLLTEPESVILDENEIIRFLNQYQSELLNAKERNIPLVHLVTNVKWFSLFEDIIAINGIDVYLTKNDHQKIPSSSITNKMIVTEEFIMPSEFQYYSNEINNSILIDLTLSDENKNGYALDFQILLKRALEFDEVVLLIRKDTYLPDFQNDKIKIIDVESNKYIHSCTNVFVYSNEPYNNKIVKRILYYAANSKVIFTNYNFNINNLLPSVMLNLNQSDYSLAKLNKADAFNILNENRNNVMYNMTLINVLSNIYENISDNSLINKVKINFNSKYHLNNPFMEFSDEEDTKFDSYIDSKKYDIEQILLFPILFLNKSGTKYEDNYLKFKKSDCDYVINPYQIKHNKQKHKKELSIIVPIHNNGKYLKFKCYQSIKKLTCYNNLEIIFIDDGSSDYETLRIIDDIREENPEIVFRSFGEGSGSASRPRNVGVDIATTKYITFLDPDNEAIDDGFTILLKEIQNDENLDMVVGNIVREDNQKRNEINYYNKVIKVNCNNIIEDTRRVLIDTNLTVQSIQALIVKKNILTDNKLKMVEGAAGQDTLFFQQLFLKCNKVKVTDQMVHSYYAYVEGSITNTVTHKFFEKFYKVEIQRIKFLESENLIDVYMKKKFNFYFKNWYLKKYEKILDLREKEKAKEYLDKIRNLYESYVDYFDDIIY